MSFIEFILALLLGVGTTLTITSGINYINSLNKKKEIVNFLYKEIEFNYNIALENLECYNRNECEAYKSFQTKAYKRYIISTPMNTIDKNLREHIINGYIVIEEFNRRVRYPDIFQEILNEEAILKQIIYSIEKIKEKKDFF